MSGFFNIIKHGPKATKGVKKAVETVKEPIKAAAQKIKSAFSKKDQATNYRKRALKMTKEATAKVGKDTKAAESRIGEDAAKKIGNETKSKMVKDFLKYNRDLKAKGGRAGYKLGKKVEKKNGKNFQIILAMVKLLKKIF